MRKLVAPIVASTLVFSAGCHAPPASSDPQAQLRAEQAQIERENQDDAEDSLEWRILAGAGTTLAAPFVAIGQRVQRSEGVTPAVAARMMDHGTTPDQRRAGIAQLVTQYDFTHRRPYTTRYQQIAQTDPDYTVRAMALRALNVSRDATATPLFITALGDPNELVRLEAAKALANVPDPSAQPVLMPIAEGRRPVAAISPGQPTDEAKDVRIAAADALRNYRNLDAARTLVNLLNERDFGIAWQSHRSLVLLTRRDLRYNQAAWLQYLSSNSNPFG